MYDVNICQLHLRYCIAYIRYGLSRHSHLTELCSGLPSAWGSSVFCGLVSLQHPCWTTTPIGQVCQQQMWQLTVIRTHSLWHYVCTIARQTSFHRALTSTWAEHIILSAQYRPYWPTGQYGHQPADHRWFSKTAPLWLDNAWYTTFLKQYLSWVWIQQAFRVTVFTLVRPQQQQQLG